MPRPSLQAERRDQILSAMERCVAKYGLHGATLEKIADEAGMARALLRHNIGNRDTLIAEFVDRYLARSDAMSEQFFSGLPEQHPTNALINQLFDPSRADPNSVLIIEALIAAGASDPHLARRMKSWVLNFSSRIEAIISSEFPSADPDDAAAVAAGITGIYFNVASLSPIGAMPEFERASRLAAKRLLNGL